MRAPLRICLLGAALALAPAWAAAEDDPKPYPSCDRQPTEGDIQGAKGAFQAGQASFNEGDYKRAIDYWEDAYRRDCTAHALLLNLARAYELNNSKRHAVSALDTYLARKPDTQERDQITKRIEVLNEKIAAESKGGSTPPPNVPPSNGGTTGPTPDKPAGGSRPVTPLIVAGAGGVLTIVGGLLFLKASGDLKDAEAKCPDRVCPDQAAIDEGNSARSRKTLWGAVTVVGIGAAVGGTVWYFMSSPEGGKTAAAKPRRHRLPEVSPTVGRGFTGLSISGAF